MHTTKQVRLTSWGTSQSDPSIEPSVSLPKTVLPFFLSQALFSRLLTNLPYYACFSLTIHSQDRLVLRPFLIYAYNQLWPVTFQKYFSYIQFYNLKAVIHHVFSRNW